MENMGHEGSEQTASTTPILDSILAELPVPNIRLIQTLSFPVVERAKERLFKKLYAGTLTQSDIEKELKTMPNTGGYEHVSSGLVDLIRMNLPVDYSFDIKRLPAK